MNSDTLKVPVWKKVHIFNYFDDKQLVKNDKLNHGLP